MRKVTNFPRKGNDRGVSLWNSQYQLFDREYALDLKTNWKTIWNRGGGCVANKQFRILYPLSRSTLGNARTKAQIRAVKNRELWALYHSEKYLLRSVVTQIKWLVVGTRGLEYMVQVVEQEKKRLLERRERRAKKL